MKAFSAEHGNQLIEVVVIGAAGVPGSVVDRAIEEKKRAEKEARRSKNSFDKLFEVWAIFDVDTHPNIENAKNKARTHGVKLAISNPCIELWGIFHLSDHDRPDDGAELQRKLHKLMPNYDKDRGKSFDYELMRPNYETAKRRSVASCKKRREEANLGGNPSTDIHELLDTIIKNGVKAFS